MRGKEKPEITVPVPLDEYLSLLSARETLNRRVRTHAQASEENLDKIFKEATGKLAQLNNTEQRAKKRTLISCNSIGWKLLYSAKRFYGYHDSEGENPHYIFRFCLWHYQYFYDPVRKKEMIEVDERYKHWSKQLPFEEKLRAELYPLSRMQMQPHLSDYQSQLADKLRPLLPFYVATHFIPRPDLPFPSEIEEILGSVGI